MSDRPRPWIEWLRMLRSEVSRVGVLNAGTLRRNAVFLPANVMRPSRNTERMCERLANEIRDRGPSY